VEHSLGGMSSDLDALAVIPAKRLLGDSSNSTSPRIKRASTSELELDSSDEVALEASHLNIMDSPSPTAPASPLTTEIVMNNQKEEEFNPPPYEELEDVVETEPDETRPTPADQIAQINLLRGRALVKGDTWFLISRIWFRRWQTACSGIAESKEDDIELGVETLGPIDNSDIADEAGKLKRSMILDVNVIAVPEDAYLLLRGW
jgi:ubiquitin carboxyl-terminal hydrolase 4/11/15